MVAVVKPGTVVPITAKKINNLDPCILQCLPIKDRDTIQFSYVRFFFSLPPLVSAPLKVGFQPQLCSKLISVTLLADNTLRIHNLLTTNRVHRRAPCWCGHVCNMRLSKTLLSNLTQVRFHSLTLSLIAVTELHK